VNPEWGTLVEKKGGAPYEGAPDQNQPLGGVCTPYIYNELRVLEIQNSMHLRAVRSYESYLTRFRLTIENIKRCESISRDNPKEQRKIVLQRKTGKI